MSYQREVEYCDITYEVPRGYADRLIGTLAPREIQAIMVPVTKQEAKSKAG